MFASLSVRSKIIGLVALLLGTVVLVGAFAIAEMRSINLATQDIHTIWLPGVQSLGETGKVPSEARRPRDHRAHAWVGRRVGDHVGRQQLLVDALHRRVVE